MVQAEDSSASGARRRTDGGGKIAWRGCGWNAEHIGETHTKDTAIITSGEGTMVARVTRGMTSTTAVAGGVECRVGWGW